MREKASVVEINGKKYDVATGKPLSDVAPQPAPRVNTQARVMDGFTAPHPVRNVKSSNKIHTRAKKSNKLHPLAAKQQQKSAEEPDLIQKRSFKPDPKRHHRAKVTPLSSSVSKFANAMNPTTPARPVAPPVKPKSKVLETAPQTNQASVEDVAQQNWFEKLNQSKPKLMPTLAGIASVLVLAGYITYVNLPNMALRLAASKAGFAASLPGYRPAGFSLSGPIAYGPGQIAVNYSSNSDQRGFVITQRQSNWDSQSLLDNYLIRENKRPVVFQEKGLTIYVYDGSNATWVDGGVWYTIEGDSLLSSEQILKIASSL